ncbi:MAG: bifunctional diguanylate cyclase/phosphodiesterase [Acidobacteriaceae bacterium]
MAHRVEFFGDFQPHDLLAISQRDLPQLLDRLLLTVPSISELYSRLGEFLLHVVKVDGVWLGSPDEEEKVRCHFSAGAGVEKYLAAETIRIDRKSDSPLDRAWRTGIPQFALDWTDDQDHLPNAFWRERGLRFGWRSSCAIPISGAGGKRDILVLYSKRSKFFGREYIRQFVLQLHSLLGFALERLRLLEATTKGQQTLALYKTAMDASANGILIAEAVDDLPIRYVNPAIERMTGYSAEEILGKNCRFLQGTDTAQPQLKTLREALRQGKPCTVELRNYRKDGTMFWNSISIAPVLNAAGRATHFIGIQKDVTYLKNLLGRSDRSNALYRALMSTAELVIGAQTERELMAELCRLLVESKLFAQVWIGRPDTAGNLEIQSICGNSRALEHVSCLPNVLTGDEENILEVRAWQRCQIQFTNDRLTDPECLPIQDPDRTHDLHAAAAVPLYRGDVIWALLTVMSYEPDIFNPELLELMERIGRLIGHGLDALDLRHTLEEERKYQSWLARHDPLTDLLNRRGLTERVEEAIARARLRGGSMAVALVDLNGFRVLSELHGHPACDLMLRTVADRLQTSLSPGDVAGRLGGDEFVLVLEDVDEEKLAVMLPQIQASVERPMRLASGRTATIPTSIGVTLFPQDNSTPEHLLRHADRALYALKESREAAGSRWAVFHAKEDEEKYIRQQAILALFREGNIRVHYQPIINLKTGEVMGVEALARLIDENNELLEPAEFLPHFSPVELTALTFQVLTQGIQDMHRLDRAGFGFRLGINLEPVTLADPQALQDLRQQIEAGGLGRNRIALELLERPDAISLTGSRAALLDLKRAGARLALDDVGSAYSSLLRVKELPVDSIKLDRTFLRGIERQPKEIRFLMFLVDMAQSLGLDLIVEGVENDASRDALAAMGVTYAQGYGIAMPMALEKLENWLQNYRPVPWTRPRTMLGLIALQLIMLDAAARILPQRPDFLKHMADCDSDRDCEIGRYMNELGEMCAGATTAHRAFHATIALHTRQSSGIVKYCDFQTARIVYEAALFHALLDASPLQE